MDIVPTTPWVPFEGTVDEILYHFPEPLHALAAQQIPALVLRGVFDSDHCAGLMSRFEERGWFDEGSVGVESQLSGGPYLDLGTSLGRVGANPAEFFAHAERTHELFSTLFEGYANPVQLIYQKLAELAPSKEVRTARQHGREFGPAIFRIYHGGEGHHPHVDSIAKRADPPPYVVTKFDYQFAGILCMQSHSENSASGEPIIYRTGITPEWESKQQMKNFAERAVELGIPSAQVCLAPGDLYFFFTENVHEIPMVSRGRPRVVLAIFAAMSKEKREIAVWS